LCTEYSVWEQCAQSLNTFRISSVAKNNNTSDTDGLDHRSDVKGNNFTPVVDPEKRWYAM